MDTAGIHDNLTGNWQGTNLLRLSWLSPSDFHSPSRLAVAKVANGKFLTFTYTWSHEDKPQEGFLLVGFDTKQERASGAWVTHGIRAARSCHLKDRLTAREQLSFKVRMKHLPAQTGAGASRFHPFRARASALSCTTSRRKARRSWRCRPTFNGRGTSMKAHNSALAFPGTLAYIHT